MAFRTAAVDPKQKIMLVVGAVALLVAALLLYRAYFTSNDEVPIAPAAAAGTAPPEQDATLAPLPNSSFGSSRVAPGH